MQHGPVTNTPTPNTVERYYSPADYQAFLNAYAGEPSGVPEWAHSYEAYRDEMLATDRYFARLHKQEAAR